MTRRSLAVCLILVASSLSAQFRRSPDASPATARAWAPSARVTPSAGGVIVTPPAGVGAVYGTDSYCIDASGIVSPVTASFTLRNLGNQLPMTVIASVSGPLIARSTLYHAGDVVVVYSGIAWPPESIAYLYRAGTTGTTAAALGNLPYVLGANVTDGGVTWTNVGSWRTASEIVLQAGAPAVAFPVTALIPAHSNTLTVDFNLWWGTIAQPAPPATQTFPVEVSDISVPGLVLCRP